MLQYLPHDAINKTAWDTCMAASEQQIIYGYSFYLDVVCDKWDAIIESDETGKYVSVFPLPVTQKLFKKAIYQPFFTQQLGLFTTSQSRQTNLKAYLKLIPEEYRDIYLQLNTGNKAAADDLPGKFQLSERVTYHLNLQQPYPEIYSHYSTNHKRNLKKAASNEYVVSESEGISNLVSLFKNTKGKNLPEVKQKHYGMVVRLFQILRQKKMARLFEIRKGKELLAGAFLLVQPQKIIFLFGASSETGKQTGAMHLLFDSVIRQYAESNAELDFEGSMVPSVAKFYAGFGAQPVTYVSLTRNRKPWYRRLLNS